MREKMQAEGSFFGGWSKIMQFVLAKRDRAKVFNVGHNR
jgi:hypothetical protein